jgi:hypothetical protein
MRVIVKVCHDEDAESPRSWDNLGVMACWHRRYNLGDVQPKEDPAEWLKENAPEGSIVLPLHLYDHSGITMRTGAFGDPWDSGQVGWIVATPAKIRENYGVKRITKKLRAKVEACLESEVKTYDDFLTGDVWGYTIESVKDCESCGTQVPDDKAVNDSCWGFIGGDVLGTMKEHIPKELHPALEDAWRVR